MYPALKRLVDLVTAALALVVLLPLFLAVAIAIRLDSKGSPFFTQERVGRGGKPFRIFKFRTMVADAPDRGPHLTQVGDPRITRVGRWLRRTSIDELPQVLNILLGHMSWIGPRPEVPAEVVHYTPEQRGVLAVRPGLSGWAQIHGRDDLDIPTKLGYDLEYVRDLSLRRDLEILLRTPLLLVSGRGIK